MAPVLLCPECGTKHPLDNVADISSFPCSGCGRTLKVPAQARELSAVRRPSAGDAQSQAAAPPVAPLPVAPQPAPMAEPATQVFAPAPVPAAAPAPPVAAPAAAAAAAATVAPPMASPQGLPPLDYTRPRVAVEPDSVKEPAPVPAVWVRFLLWIVAVPLAFLIVFGVARGLGVLSTNEITDVALAEGWGRFWPIVRLLPFIALVTALIVTGGVYGLSRMRAKQKAKKNAAKPPKTPVDHSARTLV